MHSPQKQGWGGTGVKRALDPRPHPTAHPRAAALHPRAGRRETDGSLRREGGQPLPVQSGAGHAGLLRGCVALWWLHAGL